MEKGDSFHEILHKGRKIIVDADACPRNVRSIAASEAKKWGFEFVTVASFKHNIKHNITDSGQHVMVGNEPQAVDIAVVNMTACSDIVITQDWGLAALILAKGAAAIAPDGRVYKKEKMDMLLEQRHQASKIRRAGGRTGGPAARSGEDDSRFKLSLQRLIREMGGYTG